jgi:Uma2 family endonuclease
LSPGDSKREVKEKAADWLDAGTVSVWIVDLVARTVTVHRQGGIVETLTEHDEIDGGELLPGFRASVAAIFEL